MMIGKTYVQIYHICAFESQVPMAQAEIEIEDD